MRRVLNIHFPLVEVLYVGGCLRSVIVLRSGKYGNVYQIIVICSFLGNSRIYQITYGPGCVRVCVCVCMCVYVCMSVCA